MSNFKVLYVIGDSFSFGQELGERDVSPGKFFVCTDYMKWNSYTGIIAKHWGIEEIHNVSFPGGSNDRIHRMISTNLPLLLKKYAPEEIFVFISLSHASRREFFDVNLQNYSPFISSHSPPKENKPVYSLWENYILNFDSPTEQADRHFTQIASIQSFLKNLEIDYLMTRSMNDSPEVNKKFDQLENTLINIIDRRHFPKIMPFNAYAGTLGVPFGPGKHPLEDGHIVWAEYLMKYMQEAKIGKL